MQDCEEQQKATNKSRPLVKTSYFIYKKKRKTKQNSNKTSPKNTVKC